MRNDRPMHDVRSRAHGGPKQDGTCPYSGMSGGMIFFVVVLVMLGLAGIAGAVLFVKK